jgi:hypothetical protein
MFSFRWLQHRDHKKPHHPRPLHCYRPVLQLLEDRTVPSGFGRGFPSSLLPAAGPATHLQVIVPEDVQSGSSFTVLVEAEDASNRLATGYTGTVTFSLGTPDAGATLPAAYTFTASDHGVHRFTVTLNAAGSETINATGTIASGTIKGSATTTVTPAPVATQLLVITSEQAATGVPTNVTVEALDAAGHVIPNYTGTITLTSSDTKATGSATQGGTQTALPLTYTFTASDHGRHTFQLTFGTGSTTGTTTTVTATSTASGGSSSITGSASLTVFPATTVTHFDILPGHGAGNGFGLGGLGGFLGELADFLDGLGFGRGHVAVAGSPKAVTIEALNAANQVVTGYTGTITLTSSDTAAVASATSGGTTSPLSSFQYTFTASDNGSHTFYVTFNTTGQQTLTATDAANSSATGSTNVRVVS